MLVKQICAQGSKIAQWLTRCLAESNSGLRFDPSSRLKSFPPLTEFHCTHLPVALL